VSLPDEEARALEIARQLLLDLTSGREKRIPSATRKRASQALRHYPVSPELTWLELHGVKCSCPAHDLDRGCPVHGIEQRRREMVDRLAEDPEGE
jgi:hypothetical protein